MEYTREILKSIGLSPERIQIFWCSAAEGQVFQKNIQAITEKIRNLGSNPLKETLDMNKENKDSKKKTKSKTV